MIDDDPITNYLHRMIIEDLNITDKVEIRTNGEDGMKFLDEFFASGSFPDIIFLDLKMPVMDGFEFLEACKKSGYPTENVVMLTTSRNPRDIEQMHEWGIKYLSKPLTKNNLFNVINEHF